MFSLNGMTMNLKRVLPLFRMTIALVIQTTMLIACESESAMNTGNTTTN
jgi:hypothetical protein